jgi:hypothetical protein
MTLPIEKVCKHIFTRITENLTRVDVDRVGRWIEVRINTVFVGRTKHTSYIFCPQEVDCEECLVIGPHVILLNIDEMTDIAAAMCDV